MLNLGAVLVGTNHWGGESQPEKWVIRTVVETASVGRYDSISPVHFSIVPKLTNKSDKSCSITLNESRQERSYKGSISSISIAIMRSWLGDEQCPILEIRAV